MATAGEEPVVNTPAQARSALEADLIKVLGDTTLETAGWKQPDPLTLHIPVYAFNVDGSQDEYLLRLHFGYYPIWPPSAQFINPASSAYSYPGDVSHLPRIEGTDQIAVHAAYDIPNKNRKVQLICCSTTLEFYQVLHGVEASLVWDYKKQNFSATLAAVRYGLRFFYKGRQKL